MSTKLEKPKSKFWTGVLVGAYVSAIVTLAGVGGVNTSSLQRDLDLKDGAKSEAIAYERAADYGRQIDAILDKTGGNPDDLTLAVMASQLHPVGSEYVTPSNLANGNPGALSPLTYKVGGRDFCVEYEYDRVIGSDSSCEGLEVPVRKPSVEDKEATDGMTGRVSPVLMAAGDYLVLVEQSAAVGNSGALKVTYVLSMVHDDIKSLTLVTKTGTRSVPVKNNSATFVETSNARDAKSTPIGITELRPSLASKAGAIR